VWQGFAVLLWGWLDGKARCLVAVYLVAW
jgi:hypothetical protein